MDKCFPSNPGVYLFKDRSDHIIYIGKAINLAKRIQSYFRKNNKDWKVQALVQEHVQVDYIITASEIEAYLLEAKMIGEHKPKYNVLLREGQPFVYFRFTNPKDGLPSLDLVRNKKKRGMYVGPFLQKYQARKVFEYLVKTFRLSLCNKKIEHGCLDFHLDLCAGNCRSDFDVESYRFRVQLAQNVLRQKHDRMLRLLKDKIEQYNKELAFEKAKHLYEYVQNLDQIIQTIKLKFSDSKYRHEIELKTIPSRFFSLSQDDSAYQLQILLGVEAPVRVIDCFDISHFQSSFIVGACVRFVDGVPEKNKFRLFKIKTLTRQDDYAALQEIVQRRYRDYIKNGDGSDVPDVVFIDGGKGQLSAVKRILPDIPCMSLAKKEEILFFKSFPKGLPIDVKQSTGKLLLCLRDYAHHFAVTFHIKRRSQGLKPS